MTLSITVPDTIATRLVALPQAERDSEVADALAMKWNADDELTDEQEAAINRGIDEFDAGKTLSHDEFIVRWRECRATQNSVPIPELDRAVLTADLPEHGLIAGDFGTVVHVHKGGAGYEVEFFALTGDTIAVATVHAAQVRPVRQSEVAHVRQRAAV